MGEHGNPETEFNIWISGSLPGGWEEVSIVLCRVCLPWVSTRPQTSVHHDDLTVRCSWAYGNISDCSGSISLLGKYLLTCTPCSSGEVTLELEWNQRERNDLKTPLSTHLTNAIKSYQRNLKFEWMDEYHIRGYTEARVTSPCGDTIYRCSEDYRGNAWNDWAPMGWTISRSNQKRNEDEVNTPWLLF